MRTSVLMLTLGLAVTTMLLQAAHAAEPRVGTSPVLEDRYPERRVGFPDDVIGLSDLTYSSLTGYRPLVLDLYKPAKAGQPLPLVIYLHGGGWQSGHTRHSGAFEDWPGVLASIAARGYVVASVEYRLSGEAPFPAAIQDVKTAIRWLRSHAREFDIDRTRAVVWGGSAGGQLAALAGASCGVAALEPTSQAQPSAAAESDCVQGVVAWYGIFDFKDLLHRSAQNAAPPDAANRYLGCASGQCSEAQLTAASAISYVDSKDPPVLMIHGVNDGTVPIAQSRSYLAALRAAGVKGELVEIPGVDHSFIGENPQATRAASLRALDQTLAFIQTPLKSGR